MNNPELLNEKAAARVLCLKPQTLQAWRHRGQKLPFVKVGRRVFYRAADLRTFIRDHVVLPIDFKSQAAGPDN